MPGRFLADGSGTVPFPLQVPHFACGEPLPLQRWHVGELLAPVCPLPLQLGQGVRMNPVPLQVLHVGILAVLFLHSFEMLCWLLIGGGLMCMLEKKTNRSNRG